MDELQHQRDSDECQPVPPISCDFYAIPATLSSYLLESNAHTIAELTQSVFKRKNPCVLRAIDDMLYPQ
jgi:hypothetical protein